MYLTNRNRHAIDAYKVYYDCPGTFFFTYMIICSKENTSYYMNVYRFVTD